MTKSPILDRMVLNTVQRDAVAYCEGPQLVFAGAGTGKTRVLTAKIAYLIETGYYPGQLFAATFTNKAAREMRTRVEELTGMPPEGLWIGTFHSMCARILRRECKHIGYEPSFTIYDTDDQIKLIKKILKSFDIDDRSMPPRAVLSAISRYKNACTPPQKLEGAVSGYYEQEILRIYVTYQKSLTGLQAMDFDDLIANVVYLFWSKPEVLARYRSQFRYVLVDEYQDTNTAQFNLLKLLSAEHQHIFAVGDDDQSIYGWRGAQIENILSFEKFFPNTRVFKLEQNYRSTKLILDFANSAISENKTRAEKQLWTDRRGGESVGVIRYRDDRQEAESVADKIEKLLQGNIKGGEIAILFRTNAQSRSFEDSLRKHRVPYVLVGGTGFYDRAEIKDCLAYLRLLVNPRDDMAFERIYNLPARGLGDKAHDNLVAIAKERNESMLQALLAVETAALGSRYQKGFGDLKETFTLLIDLEQQKEKADEILNQMLQLTGYMDMLTSEDSEEGAGRIENINELLNALSHWAEESPEKGLADFLEEVALVTDVDSWDRKENAVNLMTLHCAKGLEFRCVFLVGVEDGILPSRQNLDDPVKMEEERRLLYVGATRAMERLECSHVDYRWRFGDLLPSEPSRFLRTIPPEFFTFVDNSSFFGNIPAPRIAQGLHSDGSLRTFRVPASSTPSPRPASSVVQKRPQPTFDEFSQDTVEYRMGQHVKHKVYGRGRILSISGFGDDMRMTVLFNDGSRRKLMAKFANFETT